MQKSVFISGAASGIGLLTAQKCAELGWKVYAADLPDADFSALSACVPLTLDIRDREAVFAAVQNIESLDALVNNAGVQIPSPLETISEEVLRQHFDVNLFGHLNVIQAMLPLLRKSPSPRIVNVSSLMGKVAMPMMGAYSMSKHALEAMSDTLRLELASFGIQVSLIEMGAVATPMSENAASQFEPSSPLYADLLKLMAKALKKQNRNAIPPELVTKAILHALTAKKAKPRYQIDAATMGLFMMKRFAPDEIADKILLWSLGL